MSGFPEYGKSRFPKQQPKGVCRGCRGPIIEKRRITWCSSACEKKFHPFYVKRAVYERDGGKCQLCGKDCSRIAVRSYEETYPKAPSYSECGCKYPYNGADYRASELYKKFESEYREWKNNSPRPEYDHIIPHSEGGLFVMENIRLLCRKCHKERTKLWHKSRRKKKA